MSGEGQEEDEGQARGMETSQEGRGQKAQKGAKREVRDVWNSSTGKRHATGSPLPILIKSFPASQP